MSYTAIKVNVGNASQGTTIGFKYPSVLGFLEKGKTYTLQFKARALSNSKILDKIFVNEQKLDAIRIDDFEEVEFSDGVMGHLCYITFKANSDMNKPMLKIGRVATSIDIKNTDIFEFTDISLAYGKLKAYDSRVGDFKLLKQSINTKIQQLANSIVLSAKKEEVDELAEKVSEALGQIQVEAGKITLMVKKGELNSLIEQLPDSVKVAFNNISSEWVFDSNKFTNKVEGKTGLSLGRGRLNVNRHDDGKPVGYYGQTFSTIPSSEQKYWGNVISGTYRSYYTDIGYNPTVKEEGDSTSTGFDPFMKYVFYPYGTAYPQQGIYVFKDMILQQKLEIMNALKLHWHVDLGTNNEFRLGDESNALWCMYSNRWRSTNREMTIIPGVNSYGGVMVDGNGYFKPINTGGAYSLGTTQNPFYKLYAVDTSNIVSDERTKTDIVYLDEQVKPISLGDRANISTELTTEDFRNFIKNTLRLASYRYNMALEKGDTETNIGFIAQDILYDKVGSNIVQLADKKDLNSELSYNQGNYISVIAGALQEEIKFRDNQIEALEKENKNLKSRLDKIEKILGITK
ncbi:MAG: tail fiber domain-containing protein [Peptostreptococcaceae bacterium]|nr:tail fiber domain-containing protein [Peptostreptococcaceae bacterium]